MTVIIQMSAVSCYIHERALYPMIADKKPKIAVLGAHTSAYIMKCERLPTPGEYIVARCYDKNVDGGKGSNQVISAARLGAKTMLISRVGKDEEGSFLLDYLKKCNVDISNVSISEETHTGIGLAFMNANGLPLGATALGANAEITCGDIDIAKECIAQYDIILISLEIDVDVALYCAKIAKALGLKVIVNPSPADAVVDKRLDNVDIITPNEPEAKMMCGFEPSFIIDDSELVNALVKKTGVENVIITLGDRGAVTADHSVCKHYMAPKVKAVDTSGAGDCFNATLAYFIGTGYAIDKAVEYAVKAASLSVTKKHVWPSYPSLEDVLR